MLAHRSMTTSITAIVAAVATAISEVSGCISAGRLAKSLADLSP